MLVYDPIAGGDALLVLDIGSDVEALAVFKEPATGRRGLRAVRALKMGRCASSTLFLAATAARARRGRQSECAGHSKT